MTNTLLLYDIQEQQTVEQTVLPALTAHGPTPLPYHINDIADIHPESNIITYLSDEQLIELITGILGKACTLTLLPHPRMKEARMGYGVADSLDQALEDINDAKNAVCADLLLCNGRPVVNKIVFGNSLSLMAGSVSKNSILSFLEKMIAVFRGGKMLVPRTFTITTEDKSPLTTAAIGLISVLHGKTSYLTGRLVSRSDMNTGRMHVLILSPKSIIQLLRYYFNSLASGSSLKRLPSFIGHIKAKSVRIESSAPIDFSQDNSLMSADSIELEVYNNAFQVVPGRFLVADEQAGEPAEIYRVNKLPKGETYLRELSTKPLSWVYHASTEEFKDLFMVLRENAKVKSPYLTLMVLSTLLAALGLFSNSSPVIIGAMILAPLMSPIISLSMGVLRQERQLIASSVKTIGLGLLLSYCAAILITLFTPLHSLNAEITARIRPNLLDLGVAIVSGIAGAYAHAREEVAKTLAGVAIAVALVPPLAVSGIGIGWGDGDVFMGALLLFFTNLTGIVLAAAFTFMLLGFSPFHLARKGLIASLLVVVLISFPLGYGFADIVRERNITRSLENYRVGEIVIKDVAVVRGNMPLLISIKLVAKDPINSEDLEKVKQAIQRRIKQDVQLEIVVSMRR
ncbi:DUF389 domain-containing protein [Pontibacter sp. E15-1]|uniref:DUF389 domain-containing protein n=1 Tax=Pontibacter sp. E15-1 TaxID=2919918 RepID=UPI001F4FE82D|nr:DUF389 domain-containing protein [Pontibacter sp. E15-1]MCJ8166427.1 DUF389 domain-containing protein [Pontibacter sp. E15-1]